VAAVVQRKMRGWLKELGGMDLSAAVFVCVAGIWETVVKLFSNEKYVSTLRITWFRSFHVFNYYFHAFT